MTYGVGTDIIEIDRFKNLSERFMKKCFTEQERTHLKGRHIQNIAGCFAAKEAVCKAMGTGFTGFMPASVEIVHNSVGKPEILLHGEAKRIAEDAGIAKIEISISHCRTFATAFAVALTNGK